MSTSPIPIEDDPCDVIAKAMRGLGISRSSLAEQCGLTDTCLGEILDGEIDPGAFHKIAPVLQLSAQALAELPSYRPGTEPPPNLEMIVSPYGHAGVNSYIVSRGREAVVFDTGTDAAPILDFLTNHELRPAAVIITHRHADHTAGVDDFGNTPVIFPEEVEHGQELSHGGVTFTVLDVSGHAAPARAYFCEELEFPVCLVGDCLFAGSMGGTSGPESYRLALKTIRESILPLPDETILGTGHGPLTSLGLEKRHNPFLAD